MAVHRKDTGMTQAEVVLKHLKAKGTITSMEAFEDYGITRLAARISDLREQGYSIATNTITRKNRYGQTTNFAEYRLLDKVDRRGNIWGKLL